MCELLAMSANTPTDLCFSFTGVTASAGQAGRAVMGLFKALGYLKVAVVALASP
ncbi:MAG: class II glutamine amidotransferase, partial [Marinobacter sp.]